VHEWQVRPVEEVIEQDCRIGLHARHRQEDGRNAVTAEPRTGRQHRQRRARLCVEATMPSYVPTTESAA